MSELADLIFERIGNAKKRNPNISEVYLTNKSYQAIRPYLGGCWPFVGTLHFRINGFGHDFVYVYPSPSALKVQKVAE